MTASQPRETSMDEYLSSDLDGDSLKVMPAGDNQYPGGLYVQVDEGTQQSGVYLERRAVLALYEHLGAHLAATALDAEQAACCEVDGIDVCGSAPCALEAEPATILEEAQQAVYGDRQADYGHPREDFTRTAIIWTGLLLPKLADGAHLEPEDIARCLIGVKLARDVHAPKRDNRVDMAGYALTLDRLETGR